MRTRVIPRTTLEASALCLGTAEFGSVVEDSLAEIIIDRYIDGGGNGLDTAEVYAEWVPGGSHRSEEFLGRWLRKHKLQRPDSFDQGRSPSDRYNAQTA